MARRRQKGTGNLVPRGKVFYMRYYQNGERIEESTGTGIESEARKKLTIRLGEVAAGLRVKKQSNEATVKDACRLVIEDYRDRRLKTTDDVETRVKLHIVPKLGSVPLDTISSQGLKAYIKARKNEGAEDATVNRDLSIIRRGLKLAMEQEPPWITSAPKVRLLHEDNARDGFIDHEQYKKLRDLLPPHVQMALVIGYHVGLRRGAVVRLRLDQADLKAGVIRIESGQAKNKERHFVPLFGDLKPYAEMALASNRKYLCELGGKPLGSFRKTWITACKAAGLPDLMFHDLRRSAVRNMIQAGVPESVAMKISGHKTQSMLKRYNIIAERDVVRAGQRIDEHLNGAAVRLGEELGEEKKERNAPN